jgi:hypothetical protein
MTTHSNGASGHSPVSLDYTVDLSGVPPNARIVSAQATYSLPVSSPTVTDSGGSGGTSVVWGAAGIALLNSAMGGTVSVHAVGSWSGSPPVSAFNISTFAVGWIQPNYP